MALLGKIIQALAAIIPAVLAWLDKRKAAQEQAAAQDRVDAVRDDPGAAWMRKFGPDGQLSPDDGDDNAAGQAGTDKPGSAP